MGIKYRDIIDDMTLEEKAYLCTGKDMWSTYNIDRLKIPSMVTSDGPHGLRKQVEEDENNVGFVMGAPATCFPTAATMANSWDEKLGEEVGKALGEEALYYDVNVLLGPGLNIKRSPLCGRNFEYFSEDPYLSGKMAASYVRGIQSQGVASCIKHFAANSQEYQRMCNNSVIDERTFREIYTTGFEIAVKESNPLAIMSSYNMVNGIYAFENRHLIKHILRDEWGFNGCVISDWGACNDIVKSLKAGGNLEMPGCGFATAEEIIKAVQNDELSERVLDKRVSELLDVILWTYEFKNYGDKDINLDSHHALARKAARESIVLLKNEGAILPLDKEKRVAVIGELAEKPRIQGGGSSIVTTSRPAEAIISEIKKYDINYIGYEKGYELGKKINISEEEKAINLAKTADIVLLFAGLDDYTESEGFDRTSLDIPKNQTSLINKVCEVNSNVIVVLAGGAPFVMPWVNGVKGILHGYLTGQAGASAILDVISGNFNPCGKLAETYPLNLSDVPCSNYYPEKRRDVVYKEGLYVGYRYYDSTDTKVLFPFGFGLSYTQFTYADLKVSEEEVSFDITNSGDRDGAEIAQIYIGRDAGCVYRVKKELKGFKKVFLKAGETKRVTIELDDKAFRYYDVNTLNWVVEPGTYTIYVASSVNDVRLKDSIDIGPCRSNIPDFFDGNVKNISDEEFEKLYGTPINVNEESELLVRNDSLSKLSRSKSLMGRIAVLVVKSKYKKAKTDMKKRAELAGILDMPFRGLGKLASGTINSKMVDSLVDVANGHPIRGWKAFFEERKRLKNEK
ncbi:MAG TPA: glycosyl hydrolase [Lachnospiraceae bacterium]|nr:glycosyl hydrolase [Lachnospiraceae bacterium]